MVNARVKVYSYDLTLSHDVFVTDDDRRHTDDNSYHKLDRYLSIAYGRLIAGPMCRLSVLAFLFHDVLRFPVFHHNVGGVL